MGEMGGKIYFIFFGETWEKDRRQPGSVKWGSDVWIAWGNPWPGFMYYQHFPLSTLGEG
jgi:hypothetical protein